MSPTLDRQDLLQHQIRLAEEKNQILLCKQEMQKLEVRQINMENTNTGLPSGGSPSTASNITPAPPGFVNVQQQALGGAGVQLFYADGSPYSSGDGSLLATSTLQAGLSSVGLGLQALGLAGDVKFTGP